MTRPVIDYSFCKGLHIMQMKNTVMLVTSFLLWDTKYEPRHSEYFVLTALVTIHFIAHFSKK